MSIATSGGIHRTRANGPVAAALLAAMLALVGSTAAEAKTPGKTYCFNGICHRVNTLQEMNALVGKDQTFKTSFYDDCKRDRFNPCGLTASGEVFRPNDADNAASPIYPEGTVLLVRNPANGQSAVVRVNNAGPYWANRKLDVSRGTAEKLGFKKRGVANLDVRVVAAPTPAEARYKKNRRYDPVAGPIGQFASLDNAQGGLMLALAGEQKRAPARIRLASADGANAGSGAQNSAELTPADALRAEARRLYGIDRGSRTASPASLLAQVAPIAPILRSRSRYWAPAAVN